MVDSIDRIKIIGTSHIAKQSINEIKKAVASWKPDLIALELDSARAQAILQDERSKISWKTLFQVGVKGYLFAKIGQFVQQKLGKMVGVSPGSEMKAGLEIARENKLQLALIDQPIQITLKRFSQALTWKEKFRFCSDLLQGLLFPNRQIKKFGLENFDLRKVPVKAVIEKMILQLEQRYPNVYKVLVEERNRYMLKKIVALLRNHPEKRIMVIVGAGHEKGLQQLLLKVDLV